MKKLNLKKEDGSLNWKFIIVGTSYKKFLVTTVWFIAVLLMAYGYSKDIKQYKEVYENPCNYCEIAQEINFDPLVKSSVGMPKTNTSILDLNRTIVKDGETKKPEGTKKGEDSSAA